MWNPVWYTIDEFKDRTPRNVFFKEHDAPKLTEKELDIQNLHILARSTFELNEEEFQKVKSQGLKLKITADDYYKLFVNGEFIIQGPAPAYFDSYYYQEIDIASFLVEGKNVLAAHLYYQGIINRVWNSGDNRFGIAAEFEGDIKPELNWKYKKVEAFSGDLIGYDVQFLENFDSRKWTEDWAEITFDDNNWKDMVEAAWADYTLSIQPTENLSVYRKEPKIIEKKEDGNYFIDIGEEITEDICLTAKGKAGQRVIIQCGEELTAEGTVRHDMRCYCDYSETWTLDEGINTRIPYDYKGFRYAQLIVDEGVEIQDIYVLVRHYPMDESLISIKSSDKLIEQIFEVCKNGVKYGTQDTYLDCPTREKGQYLGDTVITGHSHAWLTDDRDMLLKCIDQYASSSKVCKGIMAVVPGSFMQEIADFSLLWPLNIKQYYLFTGDKEVVEKYLPYVDGVLEHFSKFEREDGLLETVDDKWNLVDWPDNLRDGYDFPLGLNDAVAEPGCHNVINLLYIGAYKTRQELYKIVNGQEDPKTKEKIESLMKIHKKVFYSPEQRLMIDAEGSHHASLHSNTYAMFYGITPEEDREFVADWIFKKGFACGVMHSYFVMKALASQGKYDEIYSLLMSEDEQSYHTMISEGATTCFESWGKDQKWNTSLCHPWASGAISVLIEDIAGIRLNPNTEKGYEINPHIPETVAQFELNLTFKGEKVQVKK